MKINSCVCPFSTSADVSWRDVPGEQCGRHPSHSRHRFKESHCSDTYLRPQLSQSISRHLMWASSLLCVHVVRWRSTRRRTQNLPVKCVRGRPTEHFAHVLHRATRQLQTLMQTRFCYMILASFDGTMLAATKAMRSAESRTCSASRGSPRRRAVPVLWSRLKTVSCQHPGRRCTPLNIFHVSFVPAPPNLLS